MISRMRDEKNKTKQKGGDSLKIFLPFSLPFVKAVGGGLGSKFEFSLILTYVVGLCFPFPKWAQPPLNSQRTVRPEWQNME